MIKSLSYIGEILPILLLFFYIKTNDCFFLKVFVCNLFVVTSVVFLKKSFPLCFGDKDMFKRPEGACNCSLFGGGEQGDFAFPSGHAASVTFICLALYYRFKRVEWLYLIPIVAFSRLYSKCHSLAQVIAGCVYGYVVFYITIKKIF
jgi:membrane-associated phospholipid phosphatase